MPYILTFFVSPIEVLVEFTEMFQKGFSGFRRFEEVMNEIPEIQDSKDAKDLDNVSGNIDFDHVSFQYNDNEKVIDDVDLHIKAGEKIALVGPSGSGKTTLCSLLSRFYDVTTGSICIDGQNIKDVTLKSLRSNIGLVQQDVYLFTGTIEQNIAYGRPNATHEEIVEAAKRPISMILLCLYRKAMIHIVVKEVHDYQVDRNSVFRLLAYS